MPNYSYQALDSKGKTINGFIEAATLQAAEAGIGADGMIPLKVSEAKVKAGVSSVASGKAGGKVKPSELILFSKQFRSMFRAGIPIIRILEILEGQSESPVLKNAAVVISEEIKKGASLYDALQKLPNIFSPLYCNLMNAGEVSGSVPQVLDRLIYILEHENKVKASIRSALQYPIIVVITISIAFFVLLTFVIPKFAAIFSKTGLVLPLPTRIAIAMNNILMAYWYIILAAIAAVIMGAKYYFKTEDGRFLKDSVLIKLPILGPLFVKAAMSRFASIFSILLASGVPIINALAILSGTIGNSVIARAFKYITEQIEQGKGLAGPMSNTKFFTPMVVNMIAIGEESGKLEELLGEITTHYDEEVTHSVAQLSELIAPVLTVALAVVVGFFALAIYMPMWDMTKMVKH